MAARSRIQHPRLKGHNGPDSDPGVGRSQRRPHEMVRILIVDNQAIVRRGLKEILAREFENVICDEAEDTQHALGRVQKHDWDLVILDIALRGRSGLDVLTDLKRRRPELPVLVLSMYPEEEFGKRSLKAGASGYLNKEGAPEELIAAIRKVLSGGVYVSPRLAESLTLDLHRGARLPHEILSDREFEVLRLLAAGKTVSRIAEELHLSVPTVSTYRARLLEKMNLTTTAQLIHYAVRNHLVD